MTNNTLGILYAFRSRYSTPRFYCDAKKAAAISGFSVSQGEMKFTLLEHIKCRQVIAFKVWFSEQWDGRREQTQMP